MLRNSTDRRTADPLTIYLTIAVAGVLIGGDEEGRRKGD
jgi:hypothetical protein